MAHGRLVIVANADTHNNDVRHCFALGAISVVVMLIGILQASANATISWARVDIHDNTGCVYRNRFGLQLIEFQACNGTSAKVLYTDSSCNMSFCQKCGDIGALVTTMMLVALSGSVVAIFLVLRRKRDKFEFGNGQRIATCVLLGIVGMCGLHNIICWPAGCYHAVVEGPGARRSISSQKLGPAFALTVVWWAFALLALAVEATTKANASG